MPEGKSLDFGRDASDLGAVAEGGASAFAGSETSEKDDATSGTVPSSIMPQVAVVMIPNHRGCAEGMEPVRASRAPAAPSPAATGKISNAHARDALNATSRSSAATERFMLRLARIAVSSTITV